MWEVRAHRGKSAIVRRWDSYPAPRPAAAIVVILLGWNAAVSGSVTLASFNGPKHEAESISTASLAAPTGLTAACLILNIKLTWTASSSTFTTGYDVYRGAASGGPYSKIGSVVAPTVTYTDTTNTHLAIVYYVIQATKGNWTSANSNQGTTGALC